MIMRFFSPLQRTLWLPVVLATSVAAIAAPAAPETRSLS